MSGPAEPKMPSGTTVVTGHRRIRWMVRGICLVAVIVVLLAARQTRWPVVVAAMSPFIATGSILATHTVSVMACLGLVIGFIALLRLRWFCRWVCPVGLCADGASHLGRRCGRKPAKRLSVGRWIVLLTLAGACLGYPLLLWLDPLAIFSGALAFAAWPAVIPLLVILALSFTWPHTWCSRICPLGAFQDMFSSLALHVRRRTEEGRRPQRWSLPVARRTVLGIGAGAALASAARLAHRPASRPLRPPGAIDEPEFLGLCVRCGNCIRACPTRIIEPSLSEHGMASLLTPILQFRENYCLVDCTKCMEVCPSGALVRLSAEGKASKPIGLPEVDMNVCLLGADRECAECRRWCPHEAIRYVWSESEYALAPQIDPQKCTGCGACEAVCPTKPKKAIVVVPLADSPGSSGLAAEATCASSSSSGACEPTCERFGEACGPTRVAICLGPRPATSRGQGSTGAPAR